MSEWKRAPLESLLETGISYGIVQPGSAEATGVPIVRVKDVRNGRIATSDPLCVSPDVEAKYARTRLKGGEVLLTLVGSTGQVAIASDRLAGWNVARAIGVLRPVSDISPRWLQYFIESEDAQQYIQEHLNTTVQATLNLKDLRVLPVPVPSRQEREAIISVIGALDDKIAVNERIAHTCRRLASALFRQAVEGHHGRTISLNDIAVHKPGKYLSKDTYAAGGPYAVYGSNSVMGSHTEYLYEGGFSVLARIGSNCGSVRWSEFPAWVNNNASAIIPKNPADAMVLRHALETVNMSPHRSGSGQPFIRSDSLMSSAVTVPAESVHQQISNRLKSLARLEASAEPESRQLAQVRDTLLPQLMSGRLRVKDAEKIVKDHA
ncbi:restriction endonuclease subunit S [Streptomyces sp. NPDC055886]